MLVTNDNFFYIIIGSIKITFKEKQPWWNKQTTYVLMLF